MGQFKLRVNVTNAVSQQTDSLELFLLRRVCKPPSINILGDAERVVSGALWDIRLNKEKDRMGLNAISLLE